MVKFDILRITLAAPPHRPLLTEPVDAQPSATRTEFLRSTFSKGAKFFYHGKLFEFVPSPGHKPSDKILSGFIGKQVTVEDTLGPETLFSRIKEKKWRAAFVAVDTTENEQLVYFEKRSDIGSAQRILKQLLNSSEKAYAISWESHIHHLQEERGFLDAVEMNLGRITEIEFILYPPNVLRGFDKVKKLQEEINKEINAEEGSIAYRNREGNLDPKSGFVADAVKYTTDGGGATLMKSGRRRIFDSRRDKKTKEVPQELMPRQAESAKIHGLIDYLFGRRDVKTD